MLALGDAAAGRDIRAFGGAAFEPLVVRVVGAESVVELEPGVRDILGVHVAERAVRFLVVQLLIQREERIVKDARLTGRREVRVGHMYDRCNPDDGVEPWKVVEFGGVRNRPRSRPLTLLPRCVKWPRVSAYEKLPPTVRPSVR